MPLIHAAITFGDWAAALPPSGTGAPRLLLSLRAGTQALAGALAVYPGASPVTLLSGPEGGLSPAEENAALLNGFVPVSLGGRILRAETAPLACLALLTLGGP